MPPRSACPALPRRRSRSWPPWGEANDVCGPWPTPIPHGAGGRSRRPDEGDRPLRTGVLSRLFPSGRDHTTVARAPIADCPDRGTVRDFPDTHRPVSCRLPVLARKRYCVPAGLAPGRSLPPTTSSLTRCPVPDVLRVRGLGPIFAPLVLGALMWGGCGAA